GSNQLSDEMTCALRLFELKSIVNLEPIWIDVCINSCYAYTEQYKEHIQCKYCEIPRYQNAISNVDLIS
ncbi:688_t:CDS:2, partial [Funneliformis geosporum]